MIKVQVNNSSFINKIAYDGVKRVLSVLFNNGKLFQYDKVGSTVARDFIEAPSKGQFFHQNIRDKYEATELVA